MSHYFSQFAQYLADFGGTTGLWIGASVLTFIELCELIAKLSCVAGARKCHTKRQNVNTDEGCQTVGDEHKEHISLTEA